jgi:sec-independent protein translocase protein TatB
VFDIGFSELLVILVVSLLVIGPERLPAAARTFGLWFGRLKYQLLSAKQDFEREIGADEVKRQLRNEQVMRELGEPEEEIRRVMKEADSLVAKNKGADDKDGKSS